jgi:hypothetical protein
MLHSDDKYQRGKFLDSDTRLYNSFTRFIHTIFIQLPNLDENPSEKGTWRKTT